MMRTAPRLRRLAVCFAVALLLMGSPVRPAGAGTTYNVATVADLQSAIAAVNAGPGGDLIVLAPGFYGLTSQLNIDQDVTIQGDAFAPTVIDGSGVTILNVNANNITLQNLTLQNGETAISYGGSGVFSGTGLTITGNSTGFYPGDGGGATFFTNSTIANNSGTGILIQCAELHLTNVTVSNNTFAGVYIDFPCGETMQFANSLIVANGTDCTGGGSFTPVGDASFDSDGSCVAMGFGPGLTKVGLSALGLGGLSGNGGPTLTEAIPAASPAVNAGDNAVCPATDQRGFLRNDGQCDIGAYEYGAAAAAGGNTPTGPNVSVSPAPGVKVTFSDVTVGGDTTATTGGPLPPTGFQVDGVVYDVSTTAVFTPPVTVCLPYNPTNDPIPHLYHYENVPPPAWVDRTSSVDLVNHVVCGTSSSLSPFAVLMPSNVSGQLQELQSLIDSFNLKKPAARQFTHRLDEVRRAWTRYNMHDHSARPFCEELAEFTRAVRKQSGKTLTAAEANQVLAMASLIAGEVGCGHRSVGA